MRWEDQRIVRLDDETLTTIFLKNFEKEITISEKVENDREKWHRAGRVTADKPNKEDETFWREYGPRLLCLYADHVAEAQWTLWTLPEGEPAIEVGMLVDIGGVPTKQHVDRMYVLPTGELVVRDIKTGAREPDSDLQLGVYAYGIYKTFGLVPSYGDYYMARKGVGSELRMLTKYNEDYLVNLFSTAYRSWENKIFLPNPGSTCRTCGVARYCDAVGGDLAGEYRGQCPEA